MFCKHLNGSFEREKERESKTSAEKSVFPSQFQLETLGCSSEAISVTLYAFYLTNEMQLIQCSSLLSAEKPAETCRALIIIKNIVYVASRWLYKIHI
jgi:hypothetical protein